ncbi:MAG: single-stranded DNA-binding protein, partial [Spirochaetales bacterium]|nr:single-stranded DNA-binding protein [Spirochaetales bacterium]
MNNLNSVLLEGNLTRDPEVVQLAEGTTMTRFSIGVNRYYMNRFKEYVSEASFFVII